MVSIWPIISALYSRGITSYAKQRDTRAIIIQERLKVSNMVEVIGGNYAVKHLPCFCQRAFEMEETLGIVMINETGSARDCESRNFL